MARRTSLSAVLSLAPPPPPSRASLPAPSQVGTWHTTHPDGVEVFHFPAGQTEAHHPSGLKEILFPGGHVRRVLPGGEEQEAQLHALSEAVRQPAPSLAE